MKALEVIARSIAEYALASLESGANGIYYATTEWGDRNLMGDADYNRFGLPFDEKILSEIRGKSLFNILHVCKSNNRLTSMMNLPADALSWDARDRTNPSCVEIAAMSDKILVGGITQALLEDRNNIGTVSREIEEFFEATREQRAILAPGCSFNCSHLDVLSHIRDTLGSLYRANMKK